MCAVLQLQIPQGLSYKVMQGADEAVRVFTVKDGLNNLSSNSRLELPETLLLVFRSQFIWMR